MANLTGSAECTNRSPCRVSNKSRMPARMPAWQAGGLLHRLRRTQYVHRFQYLREGGDVFRYPAWATADAQAEAVHDASDVVRIVANPETRIDGIRESHRGP